MVGREERKEDIREGKRMERRKKIENEGKKRK